MNDKNNENKWTPESERRYQYVQSKYDQARGIGLDVLKILLSTAIVIAGVPIVFFDKVLKIFSGVVICWILGSWILILLSIILGFICYLMIFEGYYHYAHYEAYRWLGDSKKETEDFFKKSNNFLDCSHWCALGAAIFFALSLLFVIIPISIHISKILNQAV